ncbi:type VII toxin-antitoxin system HepT family RNase toxin [Caldivirga sp.]|uniref:type VII toxin-antitoxin system HepT family RNase toxin n=1 Tax=Caldivirga sp. TaxID=2080243 RepID=UPI003D0D02D4
MAVLDKLLSIIEDMTKKLDELVDQEYDLTDWRNQLTVLHALQVQAQALIDMCQRLLSNMGIASEGYARLAVRLRENGLVTSEEEAFIRSIIGFRNIVVHGYATLDIGVINEILKSRDYRRILELALRLKDRAKEYWDP